MVAPFCEAYGPGDPARDAVELVPVQVDPRVPLRAMIGLQ